MKTLIPALLALALASALAAAHPGFYAVSVTGDASFGPLGQPLQPLLPGKNLFKDHQLLLGPGSLARFRVAERCDLALLGPAQMQVKALRLHKSGERRWWELRLSLKQGCLWVDDRYNFSQPLDWVVELPQGALRLPAKARYLLGAQGSSESLALIDGQGQTRAARRDMMGLGLEALPQAVSGKAAADLPCPGLLAEAAQPPRLLVLADDFDKARNARPPKPVLGPALLAELSTPNLALADQSGSTRLARRAHAALHGPEGYGLARRVGRELGSRWVLVANSVSQEVKPGMHGRKRGPWVEKARAEAEVLDVATGDLLATDSGDSRLAVAKGQRRRDVAQAALQAACQSLARRMASQLENLTQGEPHALLVPLAVSGVGTDEAVALREALSGMESVQRVIFRKFSKRALRLDVLLRGPRAAFEAKLAGLRPAGLMLQAQGQDATGSLAFVMAPPPAPAQEGAPPEADGVSPSAR